MTTLAEVAVLVQSGNKEQERTTDTLERVEKGFNKFFDQQERDRLDRLEDRLDAKRARRTGGAAAGAGAAAGFATATANAAKGAFDGLKDLALFLANPIGWARALLRGVLKGAGLLTAAAVGGSYKALKNVLDDRLKTQRGLLRIEAAELRAKEAEVKNAARRQRIEAQQQLNEEKRNARARIRAAEAQYKDSMRNAGDAEAKRFARAERAAEMQRIRTQVETAKQEAIAAKERERFIREQQRALKKAATSGNKIQLANEVANADQAYKAILSRDAEINRPNTPSKPTAPSPVAGLNDGLANAATPPGSVLVNRAPNVMSDSPTQPDAKQTKMISNAEQLLKYSDADLGDRGVYRSVQKNGVIAYKDLVTHKYVNQASLLADLQGRVNARPSMTTPDGINEAGRGRVGSNYSMGALRVGSAVVDPIGSAVQESLELGARKYGGASGYKGAMGRAFGRAAMAFGSTAAASIFFAINPKTLADGTITGNLDLLYNNLIRAVLSGKYQNVADALEQYENYVNETGVNLDLLAPDQKDMFLYLKSLSPDNKVTQPLKSFVNMQYAKYHGKVNRGYEGGGTGTAVGTGTLSSGRYRGAPSSIMIGDEINALDAMSEERRMMSGGSVIGQVGDTNEVTQVVNQTTVNSGNTSASDNAGGGLFSYIGNWFD